MKRRLNIIKHFIDFYKDETKKECVEIEASDTYPRQQFGLMNEGSGSAGNRDTEPAAVSPEPLDRTELRCEQFLQAFGDGRVPS